MGVYSLKTSSTQVNEGGTLTTTLSTIDVVTGTRLHYRIAGTGINKKDFARGALKGTLKVGADGKATISHALKADKATEGSESLTIEVFSDKKMKNQVSQSDEVTIADTSTKGVEGGGGGQPPNNGGNTTLSIKDPLTGQLIKSDTVYNGFFNSATSNNDSYAIGAYEIEANKKMIIYTVRSDGWKGNDPSRPERFDVERHILAGSFTSDANGNFSGEVERITSFGLQSDPQSNFFMETAQSYTIAKGTKISNNLIFSPNSVAAASYFYCNYSDVVFDSDGKFPSTPFYTDRSAIKGLADTSFFQKGWWQDPFSSNLI